tara:strand:+ start:282 stop:776 length:495 start_codon:yes stop_codon:yes gene_type:complete
MVVTYKTINNITFPIFLLNSSNWEEQDGLLFVDDKLVDDKNMKGATLGLRRLQTGFKELYPLKASLNSHLGIIKQNVSTFIDNDGTPFIYEKSISCSLRYYRIRKVERKDVASVLWLKDISFPIKIPRPPLHEQKWAGMLHLKGIPWMLYEFSENKKDNTRRKV